MVVYLTSLVFVILFAHFADRYGSNKTTKRVFVFFVVLTMVLLAGLRSGNVGTDTNNYIGYFKSIDLSMGKYFSVNSAFRPGFTAIALIAKAISKNYMSFLTLLAVAAVSFQVSSIFRQSKNPAISLFVLITLGFYTFFFNGARQGLAIAVFMMCVVAALQGNFRKYFLWILVGTLFHGTILVALPFYFLFRVKISIKYFLIISMVIALLLVLIQPLLSIGDDVLSDRYREYLSRGQTGAGLLTIFFTAITIFFVLFRQIIAKHDKKDYDLLLSMIILGTIIYILVFFLKLDVNVVRFSLFFHLAIVFIWPLIFRSIHGTAKLVVGTGFILVHLTFFVIQLSEFSNLIPYEFNPVL